MGAKTMGKILLVDDDGLTRLLCRDILASAGYGVNTAADGMEALELLKEDSGYDLIISDIHMPRLDGLRFYASASLKYPHLKDSFLFMTADLTPQVSSAIPEGEQRCIRKPFKITEFLGYVDMQTIRMLEGLNGQRKDEERRGGFEACRGMTGIG